MILEVTDTKKNQNSLKKTDVKRIRYNYRRFG
jgi:hypothetical protein